MSEGIKIMVRLTQQGAAILGGDAWATLDLPPGFAARMSKDINLLSDVNQLVSDGILAMSVPYSTTNDAAFIQYSTPLISDNDDTGIEAKIIAGSHELPFDRIWIKGRNDTSHEWDFEFRRSPNHWIELASKKALCTVDLGQVSLTADEVTANLENQLFNPVGDLHRWIPCDYGGWVDLAEPDQFTTQPVKRVWVEDLRPWISLPKLLQLAFCEIGWALEGQILSSDWARALWVYILSREYYTQSTGGNHKLIGATLDVDFTSSSSVGSTVPFTTVQYDPGTNALPAGPLYYGGITNNLPFKSRWKFCLSGILENTGGGTNSIGFQILDFDPATGFPTGEVLYEEPIVFDLTAAEAKSFSFCAEVVLRPGQTGVIWVGHSAAIKIRKGYRITIEPANKSLVRGDLVDLNKMVDCDLKLLDFFKGFIHMINGRIETDWINRVVTVHPYRTATVAGDSVPGFIRDGVSPIDITEKVLCDSIHMERIKTKITRWTSLQFADSTDTYIDSLGLVDPAFSRKVLNSPELEDRVTELKNPFFEPTMEGRPDKLQRAKDINQKTKPMAYFPRLWDNDQGERSFQIGPRVLFYFGMISQHDTDTGLKTAYFFESGAALTTFGYGAQLPTLPFHTDALPAVSSNLVYGSEDKDLYVTFYLSYLQRQKNGSFVDLLAMLHSSDYAICDFRTPYLFVWNGRPIIAYAESVRDFAYGAEISTPMKFVVEPVRTSCCDLPCSCRFSECEYFQDFGQYITQDTLDALTITSFKVNDIEKLTSPIDFGVIKIAEVGGRNFVMNLVDALNSIGVDYFSFNPSTTEYADKPDGRFFKIKRPACWSFEIIISDNVGEVYRYRDYDMAQKWFSGTWDPFGYGTNPVSEPQNCVTTIEY